MPERHDVIVFDSDGFWRHVAKGLPADKAVELAKLCADRIEAGSLDGVRIIITDAEDFTNFLWERGKGVVYPPRS